MLSEKQAKEKWCPFARVTWSSPESSGSGNRFPMDGANETEGTHYLNDQCRCLASGCVMWQEHQALNNEKTAYELTGLGYCGLAERPDENS